MCQSAWKLGTGEAGRDLRGAAGPPHPREIPAAAALPWRAQAAVDAGGFLPGTCEQFPGARILITDSACSGMFRARKAWICPDMVGVGGHGEDKPQIKEDHGMGWVQQNGSRVWVGFGMRQLHHAPQTS